MKVASDLRFRLISLFDDNNISIAMPRMNINFNGADPMGVIIKSPPQAAPAERMSDAMLSLKRDSLLNLLTDLVSIPSVSCSDHENRLAELIMEKFSGEPYFRQNPSHLRLLPIEGDPLGRKGAAAFYRVSPEIRETIIITGHYDVVDAEAYGPLKDLAFSPEELTRRAGELDLPDEARKDLESGEYLFGRGVSDMKGGIALMMAFLAERQGRGLPGKSAVPCGARRGEHFGGHEDPSRGW